MQMNQSWKAIPKKYFYGRYKHKMNHIKAIGANHLVFMNQMHGREILALHGEKFEAFGEPADADALITDQPHVALMVKQAD